MRTEDLERRVIGAAEAALVERQAVSTLDVLVALGWLAPSHVAAWRQGRIEALEEALTVSPAKLSAALLLLERWAHRCGLSVSETAYVARTADRRTLRFSENRDPAVERAYRTHWLSSELSAAARERLAQRQSRPPELVVIAPLKDWTCTACGGTGDLLIMDAAGPLCLACADLDHLVFLPVARCRAHPTREARKPPVGSGGALQPRPQAVRRQGILVEEDALERAEQECLADEEARARRRQRDAERRGREDAGLRERLTAEIVRLFPGCPAAARRGDRPSQRRAQQRTRRPERRRPCPRPGRGRARGHRLRPARGHPPTTSC